MNQIEISGSFEVSKALSTTLTKDRFNASSLGKRRRHPNGSSRVGRDRVPLGTKGGYHGPRWLGNDPFVGHQRYAGERTCAVASPTVARGKKEGGEKLWSGALYAEQGAP
ncbi:hypothetical protein KM043_008190 [Ampulex compressa]|nr:hypothetical protein KM043_008190 [Ampulex compressa]